MTHLLLLALLTADPDGGVESLYVGCGDAPLAVAVDGGYFVPERRQQRFNCKLSACEAFAEPRLNVASAPSPNIVIGLTVLGIVVAGATAAGGFVMGQQTAKR